MAPPFKPPILVQMTAKSMCNNKSMDGQVSAHIKMVYKHEGQS